MLRRRLIHSVGCPVVAVLVGACGTEQGLIGASPGVSSDVASIGEPSVASSSTSQSSCLPHHAPHVGTEAPSASDEHSALRYEVTALGLPDVSAFYDAFRNQTYMGLAINDAGQVVGNAEDGAYRWTPGGRVDHIDGAQGQKVWASDVNSLGQVAGSVSTPDESQPFVWEERAGLRALRVDDVAGNESAYGVRINDRGQVSGTLTTIVGDGEDSVAFRIEPDGTVDKAPVRQTKALDMNAVGEVVLTVEDETTGDQQLFAWPSGATPIGGGVITGSSSPKINEEGLVVAAMWDESAGGECGFVWDIRTGSRTTLGLGVIPGDVNGNGWVTGYGVDGDVRYAFVWDSSFGLVDLGVTFDGYFGLAINDRGQVIGGVSRGDNDHPVTSFLWDPNAGPIELPSLRAEDSTMVAGINESGTVVGVSGPLVWDGDAEQMVIKDGEPVIWSPTT